MSLDNNEEYNSDLDSEAVDDPIVPAESDEDRPNLVPDQPQNLPHQDQNDVLGGSVEHDTPPHPAPRVDICRICMVSLSTHVYIPCGHLVSCERCMEIWMGMRNICPYCRSHYTGTNRVFSI